jgi:hypothetical protein
LWGQAQEEAVTGVSELRAEELRTHKFIGYLAVTQSSETGTLYFEAVMIGKGGDMDGD